MEDRIEIQFYDNKGTTFIRVTLFKGGVKTVLSDCAVHQRVLVIPLTGGSSAPLD